MEKWKENLKLIILVRLVHGEWKMMFMNGCDWKTKELLFLKSKFPSLTETTDTLPNSKKFGTVQLKKIILTF